MTKPYELTADHRNVGVALLGAANDAGNPWIFLELVDEGFPPWAGVRCLAVGGSPESGHAVDVTDGMAAGIEALAAHAGYLASLPSDNPMADAAGDLTTKLTRFGERFNTQPLKETNNERKQRDDQRAHRRCGGPDRRCPRADRCAGRADHRSGA